MRYLKNFVMRSKRWLGCLLGHPRVVVFLWNISAYIVGWSLKIIIIALLSTAGITLPLH